MNEEPDPTALPDVSAIAEPTDEPSKTPDQQMGDFIQSDTFKNFGSEIIRAQRLVPADIEVSYIVSMMDRVRNNPKYQ